MILGLFVTGGSVPGISVLLSANKFTSAMTGANKACCFNHDEELSVPETSDLPMDA